MGVYGGPEINESGLVLALDAGNIKSYPGIGTNWTDLIGSGNNGTLTNGSYYSTSGGSIVFDGSDDNVSIGTNGFSFGSSPGTLSAWAATRDRTSTRTIVSYGSSVTNQARFLGVGQSNFYFSGYGSSIAASGISTDTWFNLVGVYDGTNASMYVNGVLVSGPTARSWNTVASNAGIGKNVSNTEYWKGDISQVSVYNRALSAAEIQQNYNALRSRYANYVPTIPYIIPLSSWIATLGGGGGDEGSGIAIDSFGNVYIAAIAAGSSNIYNVLIAKYDTSGAIQWQRTLSSANDDRGLGIAVDGSGNVYITGWTNSSGAGFQDVLIAKYNSSGAIQWQTTLGGAYVDRGYGIAVDGDGNVYITGHTNSSGAGSYDVFIAKYDTSGTIQWQRTLGGANADYGRGIVVDGSGNVYITGNTTSSGAGNDDVLIAKYNTSGTIQWQRTLGGAAVDIGQGIAVDGDGNVYVTGQSASSGAGGFDVLIAKYDTSGTIQWQRTLGGANADRGYGIAVDGDGNVYVTGTTQSSGAGNYDVLIAKYNTSGTIQWQRTLGGLNYDEGNGIAVDSFGNVYVTGQSASSGAGIQDILIAKLPADGGFTGTYGAFTYATSGLSTATSGLSTATSGLSTATSGLSTATSGLSTATSTFTSSVIVVG